MLAEFHDTAGRASRGTRRRLLSLGKSPGLVGKVKACKLAPTRQQLTKNRAGLAIANRHSFRFNVAAIYILTVFFLIAGLYTIYSVLRYFGIKRAFGIDHFDESYRNLPFVKAGIFRFTDNGMYTFGFLLFYLPGLLLFSGAAILTALFMHIYIWVHSYSTELPDIHRIYGGN